MAWIYRVDQGRHPPIADHAVSTKVDTYQEQAMPFRQIAEICRRRGGSGCGGVSAMDGATELTWTYLQVPRNRTHPAIHQETCFCCRFGS
ncbi:hypothetical protein CR920_14310 [Stenotrophomonas indicatrix]|nr:hypothetical protein CR920_14310 [Stenotrophomonas indicatrix]